MAKHSYCALPLVEILEGRQLLSATFLQLHADTAAHHATVPAAKHVAPRLPIRRVDKPGIVRRAESTPPLTLVASGTPVTSEPPTAGTSPVTSPVASDPPTTGISPVTSDPPTTGTSPVTSDPPVTSNPPTTSALTPPPLPGTWSTVFDDEFNGNSLSSVWVPNQYWANGPTKGCGLEEDTAANVSVSNGALQLTGAVNNTYGTGYTGGLVQAGGEEYPTPPQSSPAAFLYGYAEASIKIPAGQGFWPAFWLMPESSITTQVDHDITGGEIDVMEVLGNNTSTVYGTVHHNGNQLQCILNSGIDLSAGFHTFAVDWEPDHITWFVDGVPYGTITDPSMIPTTPMYPIFDLAVGGQWPGAPDAATPFPSTMDVDYIRIWQQTSAATPTSTTSLSTSTATTPAAAATSSPTATAPATTTTAATIAIKLTPTIATKALA